MSIQLCGLLCVGLNHEHLCYQLYTLPRVLLEHNRVCNYQTSVCSASQRDHCISNKMHIQYTRVLQYTLRKKSIHTHTHTHLHTHTHRVRLVTHFLQENQITKNSETFILLITHNQVSRFMGEIRTAVHWPPVIRSQFFTNFPITHTTHNT